MGQPVTTAHAFEEALRILGEDRELLADVLVHAPVGIVLLWGDDYRYRFANERARELLPGGDALVGLTFAEAFPEVLDAADELFRRVMRTGETVALDRLPVPSHAPTACEGNSWYEATFSPVRDPDGRVRGVLGVFVDVTGHEIERRGLTRALAQEHDLTVALQRGLLADAAPCVPGAEVAVRYVPATAGMTVGGDFYDVFRCDEQRWLLTIGDVCGKGADAAALTALVRHTIRAVAPYEPGPASILRAANRAICREDSEGRFCTVALAALDLAADPARVTVALGGHMPPLVRRADGRCDLVGEPGTLLGVFPDPHLHERVTTLAPGDLLLLYTDGLTEARAPRLLSPEQLAGALAATGSAAPGPTVDTLVHGLAAGPGGFRDDLALVAFRLTGR
ncbi:SpoIIE family protein phosphatase [Conexibacter stalactiti]|uniref:SpoIIE family protein phosphatase n=1 Tax=Conexibacter stalactiti TaxID=1940611 RepID=A0ABU4HYT3_9ACTN|nr:SpoIIE family protein phosphatase [Conexibacter stalactiti]MDW5598491.1 SpoIIE family protein phosphatase [Conexibacter stalactiti]MEC5039133.1 SpoIIE family protein phosphatase [Conexibacter stalactiti]